MNERIEKSVFISYRRTNFPWASAIYQNLAADGFDVFLDFKGIASGDFESVILGNIRARAHFLVLLTPSALERCGDPGDWLRREMETALETRRNIVPVMLDGFDFGTATIASQLTGTLAAIKSYSAIRIPPDYFDEGMERLRTKFLKVPLETVLHPASASARQAAAEQKEAAGAVLTNDLRAQEYFARASSTADLKEKIRLYGEAIRMKPDFAEAFYNRGLARKTNGSSGGAIEDFSEAIRLKPNFASAFWNRGIARNEKGVFDWARQDFAEAIRLRPDDLDPSILRSNLPSAQGDVVGAILDCSEAIRLNPNDHDAYLRRGNLRKKARDTDGAIKDYSEAIRLKPTYAQAFANRGSARCTKGDFHSAIEDYSEAIRLKPEYGLAYSNRGIAWKRMGDLRRAEEDFAEAKRLKAAAGG